MTNFTYNVNSEMLAVVDVFKGSITFQKDCEYKEKEMEEITEDIKKK